MPTGSKHSSTKTIKSIKEITEQIMAFYDLPKQERIHVVANMSNDILNEISPLLVFVYSNSGQASPTIYVQEAF